MEKLKLSEKKCHNIHIGKSNMQCPPLKVHGSEMQNSGQQKYLGDLVDKKGTCREESWKDTVSQAIYW